METEKKKVEFVKNEFPKTQITQSAPQGGSGFTRLWLTEEYSKLQLKLREGDNLVRFFPPIQGTQNPTFILPLLVGKVDQTEFVTAIGDTALDIASRQVRDTSPLSQAYWWFYKNQKDKLYEPRSNPNGFRLRPKQVGLSWVIAFDEDRHPMVRLLSGSLYAGDKGTKGVLGDVVLKSKEEDVDPINGEKTPKFGDISDPEKGNFVNITKVKDHEERDPIKSISYKVTISTKTSPTLHELLEKVSGEDLDKVIPLDQVVGVAEEELQKQLLEDYLGGFFKEIFA
jgi:hypothetical protein